MAQQTLPEWVQVIDDPQEKARWVSYFSLPQSIRNMLFDVETAETMWAIAHDQHGLPAEKVRIAAALTGSVATGALTLSEFVPTLQQELDMIQEDARALAKDINEQIFQPVREELMEVHGVSPNGETPNLESRIKNQGEENAQNAQGGPSAHRGEPTSRPGAGNAEGEKGRETEAKQRREELLERLRGGSDDSGASEVMQDTSNASKDDPNPSTSLEARAPNNNETDSKSDPAPSADNSDQGPRATTAAWNGKKIDLSQVPPRRERNGNGKGTNGDSSESTTSNDRYVKLEKGPDGYWYEPQS